VEQIINWLRRLRVAVIGGRHTVHFGDGKDFILVKELPKRWTSKGTFTYDGKDEQFGQYLRRIGFRDVRVVCGSVFRYKCGTGRVEMILTRKMEG